MKKYHIQMKRVYVTYLEYVAENEQKAIEMHLLDQDKYATEMAQCDVEYETSKIVRVDDINQNQ
jgi:hypothetical protein